MYLTSALLHALVACISYTTAVYCRILCNLLQHPWLTSFPQPKPNPSAPSCRASIRRSLRASLLSYSIRSS